MLTQRVSAACSAAGRLCVTRITVAALREATAADHAGVFDIAGPEVVTLRQVGDAIGARLGLQPRFVVEDRRDADLVGDITRMRAELAAPRRTLAAGLEDVL